MAFPHRKLLIIPTPNVTVDPKSVAFCCCDYGEKCSLSRYKNCPVYAKCFVLLPSPPPSPRQLPPVVVPQSRDTNNGLRELVIGALTIWACVITAALLLGLLFALGGAFYLRNRSRGRRDSPIIFGTQEDLSNEDRGPQVDRHIRYITTVGLPQSVIDSIAVFKYKNDDGLIDGTECSVCLNEFREAEVLRLLPKCSHAFHVPCIDTWLRSQRNCPLCRAAIISDAVVSESGSSSSALDSRNENVVMNLGNHNRDGSSDMAEGDSGDGRIGCDDSLAMSSDEDASENSNNDLPSRVRNGEYDPRVLSDLTDNRRVVEVDIQPMRRSVSLDLSSAVMIYNDVAGGGVHETQNSMLNTGIVNAKKLKSRSVSKRSTGSAGITKLMKSASLGIGTSLLKGPISMKRSWSSGG